MNSEIVEFAKGIYQEHLEEASFLYGCRMNLIDDPEIPWPHVNVREEQFEAHIDALAAGGDTALDACLERANEGDDGELHAAVCVMCRMDRKDMVFELLNGVDPDDILNTQAITEALKQELPMTWENDFLGLLSRGDCNNISIVAEVVGYRRIKGSSELLRVLRRGPPNSLSAVIRALGRLREKEARPILTHGNFLEHKDEQVCYETALTLLRIGDTKPVVDGLKYADSRNWPFIAFGLGGERSAVSSLLDMMKSTDPCPDAVFALGLLGDTAAVDRLIAALDDRELAGSAATALNLITGAEIYEEAFVPEEIDEDELLEEELEKLKRGESLYPPGEEPGETVIRLTQKNQDWLTWWTENKSRFDPQTRYRNGKPYSPDRLLDTLLNEKTPYPVRMMACEELAIRYGADFPFEADMLVSRQKRILTEMKQWIAGNAGRFKEGAWYFAVRQCLG